MSSDIRSETSAPPVSGTSKFVVACFLFFLIVIGGIAFGDLIAAMLR